MSHSLSQITRMMSSELMFQLKKWEAVADSSMQQAQSFISAKRKRKMEKKSSEILSKQRLINHGLTKENRDVEVRLFYDERGLDRYYGLLELGEIGGLWKNVAGRYEINGKKMYAKQILANTDEYFTEEVMQKLDDIAKEYFSYGTN